MEKNTLVWGFLKKDDQKASTSTQNKEPLTCKESEELSVAAMSAEEKKSSSMTKLTLTREQHKAEIFWALKSVMSHFSYSSAHDITDVSKQCFQIAS